MRKGRPQWRFIVGLSVLGLLVIASASYAGGDPEPVLSSSQTVSP